jgi:hypothetical protein
MKYTMKDIHNMLCEDEAYIWSVEKGTKAVGVVNMQMVLRAHGHEWNYDSAKEQIMYARGCNTRDELIARRKAL